MNDAKNFSLFCRAMFAAFTPDSKFPNLAVANATELDQTFNLSSIDVRIQSPLILRRMIGKEAETANRLGETPRVSVKEIQVANAPRTLSAAFISIDIFRFPVVQEAK